MSVQPRARRDELAARAETEQERLAQLLELSVPVPGPRRCGYVLWIELWVRALQEPSMLPECEALSQRWRECFFDTVRQGTAAGEFAPVTAPGTVADRLIALVDGLAFELLQGYSWTSPDRMRERMNDFAAEQLGTSRPALERHARAAAAAIAREDA